MPVNTMAISCSLAASMDKVARQGIRASDLMNEKVFSEKLQTISKYYREIYGFKINARTIKAKYKSHIQCIKPFITDTGAFLRQKLNDGKNILAEGAQGTFLDLDYGMYPFVTSSTTTIGGAFSGLGLPCHAIKEVIGVMKAYTTRVGGGPFPSELIGAMGEGLRMSGNEFGSTTGRPRRCGWFDAIVAKDAVEINGIDTINLTKVDVLDNFKTIKIAVAYIYKGKKLEHVPASLEKLEQIKVKYLELPGWQTSTSACRSFEQLPPNCRNYINTLERLINCPIRYIGVGKERKALIKR